MKISGCASIEQLRAAKGIVVRKGEDYLAQSKI
jgi:hypothetical protein